MKTKRPASGRALSTETKSIELIGGASRPTGRDAYPGVNAVTLMELKGAAPPPSRSNCIPVSPRMAVRKKKKKKKKRTADRRWKAGLRGLCHPPGTAVFGPRTKETAVRALAERFPSRRGSRRCVSAKRTAPQSCDPDPRRPPPNGRNKKFHDFD